MAAWMQSPRPQKQASSPAQEGPECCASTSPTRTHQRAPICPTTPGSERRITDVVNETSRAPAPSQALSAEQADLKYNVITATQEVSEEALLQHHGTGGIFALPGRRLHPKPGGVVQRADCRWDPWPRNSMCLGAAKKEKAEESARSSGNTARTGRSEKTLPSPENKQDLSR